MGEAYFFAIALDKGVCLTKIIETSMHQTPDFEITLKSGKKCYFEVKTPSLVNSQENLKEHQEQSLNARISIDAQLQAGNSVAFGETCMSPWECNNLLEMIDKGIAKIQQNIKPEQFTHTPTFLVVNWSLLQLYSNKRDGIIQPYFNNDGYIQSGEFWAMAFGNRGMPIIAFNGIEGHPTIIGNMEQFAILNRKKNSIVSGLIFLYYQWGHSSNAEQNIWGLYRDHGQLAESFSDEEREELWSILIKLHGNYWNDKDNTQAYRWV